MLPLGIPLVWVAIFAQSYLAFIFLRRRAESAGASISSTLISSIGRLSVLFIITFVVGALALVLLLHVSR